jgi:hypothetical protein
MPQPKNPLGFVPDDQWDEWFRMNHTVDHLGRIDVSWEMAKSRWFKKPLPDPVLVHLDPQSEEWRQNCREAFEQLDMWKNHSGKYRLPCKDNLENLRQFTTKEEIDQLRPHVNECERVMLEKCAYLFSKLYPPFWNDFDPKETCLSCALEMAYPVIALKMDLSCPYGICCDHFTSTQQQLDSLT